MALPDINDADYTDEEGRVCKICYGGELDFRGKPAQWKTPCNCSGSIKYVHKECLETWIQNAPAFQQSQCNTCKFPYKRYYTLKSLSKWSLPKLRLGIWDSVEILLDIYSTVKLVRGTIAVTEGRKSLLGQFCYFVFWRGLYFQFETYRILPKHVPNIAGVDC
ncbi:RING-CH-type domain-containing protein [Aphelenchoides bicaudatus]|nr:RING-CH-type domain-containing protein [Aphelenchoides bicaudatus]